MADLADLERRVTALEQRLGASERLRQQDTSDILAEIAQLAAQLASYEQRTGRRFLQLESRMSAIETRMTDLEARMTTVETTLQTMVTEQQLQGQKLDEILRRLPPAS